MKILCETQVLNRQTQANKTRAVKATLAVGFHTSASKDPNDKELEIMHFTPQNKTGVRYKIKNNIDKMFTKFVHDGKATISFKAPPDNLMIKCDPIQLKGFLQTLKLGIEGKTSLNLRLNIAAATAIPQKSHPVHRMVVRSRSDYPVKGFPKALKSLTISDIALCKISFEICSLRNLTFLNMSGNQITKVPQEIGRLPLVELNFANNSLGEANSWQWLNGVVLRKTLLELDISGNKLTYFPIQMIKLTNLVTLKLNQNSIKRIPFGIRRMKKLRYLHMSVNKLESLPSAFNDIYLEMLDIWGNDFKPMSAHSIEPRLLSSNYPAPLWLMAARVVSQAKLTYSSATLPWVLVDILLETPKCFCGRLCYSAAIWERAVTASLNNVKQLVFSRDRIIYTDVVLCSSICAARKSLLALRS